MPTEGRTLVDPIAFARARAELGAGFPRILGYFREDGIRSVEAIEVAVRTLNAAAIVIPAHTLKGDALQFGAEALSELAESIEHAARECVERQDTPEALIPSAVRLRPLFADTLAQLDRELGTVIARKAARGFGRRVA